MAHSERWEICDDYVWLRIIPTQLVRKAINLSVDTMGSWKDSIRFDKFDWTDDRANKLRYTYSPVQASENVSRTGTWATYSKTVCQLA